MGPGIVNPRLYFGTLLRPNSYHQIPQTLLETFAWDFIIQKRSGILLEGWVAVNCTDLLAALRKREISALRSIDRILCV